MSQKFAYLIKNLDVRDKNENETRQKKNNGQNAQETMVILADTKKTVLSWKFRVDTLHFLYFPHSLVDEEICFFNYRVW